MEDYLVLLARGSIKRLLSVLFFTYPSFRVEAQSTGRSAPGAERVKVLAQGPHSSRTGD